MAASLVPPLLSLEATLASTTLSKSSLYDLIGRGQFPPPVRISARRVAFRAQDIQAWLESLGPTPIHSNGGASNG